MGEDSRTRDRLVQALEENDWPAEGATTTDDGLHAARRMRPDVIVLDLVDPPDRGLEFLVRARRQQQTPIVVLVHRQNMVNLLFGLAFGAADFVTKPAEPAEITERVRALLVGTQEERSDERLVFGGLVIDRSTREVFVEDRLVATTAREFDLLAFLAASPRRVFTRAELLERVWGSSLGWQRPTTVTEHVRRLRTKIERDPHQPRWLVTVRGIGYRFEPN